MNIIGEAIANVMDNKNLVLYWDQKSRQLQITRNDDATFYITVNYFLGEDEVVIIEQHFNVSLNDTIRHIHLRSDIIEELEVEIPDD